ncbi:MAG TPA: ATP-binding protein [Rhodocyclaceae bacterium]
MTRVLDLRCDPRDAEGLRREIQRRDKIIRSLIYQVEQNLNSFNRGYGLLQNTFMLEEQVRRRTDELKKSEERFRDLAEMASDWFWETDAELSFTYLSARFFELSGIRSEDIVGKRRWEVVSEEDVVQNPGKWNRHREDIEARRRVRDFECAIRSRDGRRTIVRVNGRPRFNEARKFLGYRGTGTDITELLRMQEELVRAERLAALGGLVAGVAHEINTPVGTGLTAASHLEEQTREFAELLAADRVRRSDLDGFVRTAREVAASMTTNLRRAVELVRGFKQVAVDQSSEQRRRFELKGYLQEILCSLQPRLKRTAHRVEVSCPQGIEIVSYPGAFSQIVTNLVLNSLIHGFEHKEAGRIEIAVEPGAGDLLLRYRDDGAGMAPEHAKHLFEPFFTTRRGRGGSGLGMHVVYNLVTQTLGGKIDCSTAPGQGIEFRIRIPLAGERK